MFGFIWKFQGSLPFPFLDIFYKEPFLMLHMCDKATKKKRKKIKISKKLVKLATAVKGDQKAPFSIATTPRCRRGRYSIPRIATLNPWSSLYSPEC